MKDKVKTTDNQLVTTNCQIAIDKAVVGVIANLTLTLEYASTFSTPRTFSITVINGGDITKMFSDRDGVPAVSVSI